MTQKTYYEHLYKLWVTVFVEPDQDKARVKVEKITGERLDEMPFAAQAKTVDYQSDQGGQRIIVWLRKPEAHLLAHELIHVIEYCFEARRMPFNLGNTEFIAYLMEHLFDEFWPLVNPLNKVLPKASIHALKGKNDRKKDN